MKIKPIGKIIYFKTEEVKAGALDLSSKPTAIEFAEVLAVGSEVKSVKKGDKVFVKAWGVDSIHHQDKRYNFCFEDNGAILAIVE